MTKELMTLLNCDEATAKAVRYEMECTDLDFSECTTREFNKTARSCFKKVKT